MLLVSVVVVVMESSGMAMGSVADVNIYNLVGEAIKLHCKSRDDDFGDKVLQDHQHVGWGFTPNFWGTTVYSCSFAWRGKMQYLDVWNGKCVHCVPCVRHCVWQVRKDGFWGTEDGHTPFTFVAPWK